MQPQEIHGRLAIAGYRQEDIARELRVTPSAVSRVIHNKTTSRPIMLAIARAIKMSPKKVFPHKAHLFNRLPQQSKPDQTGS